jgi:hypothetical protein
LQFAVYCHNYSLMLIFKMQVTRLKPLKVIRLSPLAGWPVGRLTRSDVSLILTGLIPFHQDLRQAKPAQAGKPIEFCYGPF